MTEFTNSVIMVAMKSFILAFTAIMFLANAFAVSAWAKPCTDINEASSMVQATDMDDMPCHEKTEDRQDHQKNPTKHCDGICLCFHVSINHTPVLSDSTNIIIPPVELEKHFDKTERYVSLATAPPRRPPKLNS